MFRRGLLIVHLVFISFICSGQISSDFSDFDKSTYDFYLNEDWKNLITYGKWGLKNGMDYYYLRLRLGIAYFHRNNYRKAINHFRKALEHNSGDPVSLEYLYYSFLFSGMKTDARFLVAGFPPSLKERLKLPKNPGIRSFSIYNTYRWNPDFNQSTDNFTLNTNPSDNGWQLIEKNLNFFNIHFEHQLGNAVTLYHGYGYLTRMRFIALQEDLFQASFTDDRFRQYQVYLLGNVRVARNFNLNATIHFLNLRTKVYTDLSTVGGPPFSNTSSTITPDNNWIGYVSGNLDLGLFALQAGFGFSNLNNLQQFQKDVILEFYPLGNLNLYSFTKVSHQANFNQNVAYDSHFIFDQILGFKVANPFWVEINGTLGNISNFHDQNGTIIYNDMNPVKQRLGIHMIFPLINNGLEFSFIYNYMDVESRFFTYYGPETNLTNPIQHKIHSITGGIKWNISKR